MGEKYVGKAWPQELTDNLKRLHQEGFPVGKIVEIMKMSRSTILGKAWRLGLSFSRNLAPQIDQSKEVAAARRRERRRERAKQRREEAMQAALADWTDDAVKQLAIKSGNRRLKDLTWDSGIPTCCRAIVSDEGNAALYCGEPVYKRSYCESHFRTFYYSLGHRSQAVSNLR